jgi:hypothetical protein
MNATGPRECPNGAVDQIPDDHRQAAARQGTGRVRL